ncbi:hypothetical protein NEFER03_2013 [Nematocida sp. LUAm3]|nr:hypothetical protein NEFER03_2013 [Nematocida sp. LUAm3]KAI5174487.1 hypothetical protein NEFER02_0608 [Nematocida sp. LUAm2]KAI5179138.1 hypothetical protein NEFER01_2001 [Nematocida sp. LUAm1]
MQEPIIECTTDLFAQTCPPTDSNMKSIVEYKNCSLYTKKNIRVVKNASFSIPKSKTTLIMGQNCLAKIALLQSLVGTDKRVHITLGEILVEKNEKPEPRDTEQWFFSCNYITREEGFCMHIKAYDFLKSAAKCYNISQAELDKLIEQLEIENIKEIFLEDFTRYDRSRFMVALGILSKAPVSIWNEPFLGATDEYTEKYLSCIKRSLDTVVLSIRNPSKIVLEEVDHLIMLHRNTVIYSGAKQDLVPFLKQCGVVFPKNKFFIQYLDELELGVKVTKDHKKSIDVLNAISAQIHKKEEGSLFAQKRKPTIQQTFRFSAVCEVLKRSFYFDRLFPGSLILFEMFIYCLTFSIVILANRSQVEATSVTKYLQLDEKTVTDVLKSNNISISKNLSALLEKYSNFIWNDFYCMHIVSFSMISFIISLLVPMNTSGKLYYRHCKESIDMKQFSAIECISSSLCETALRKVLLPFFMQMALYTASASIYKDKIGLKNDFGYVLPGCAFFLSSLVMGLYTLLFRFSPFSFEIISVFILLHVLSINILPFSMINIYGLLSQAINIYYPNTASIEKYFVKNYLFNPTSYVGQALVYLLSIVKYLFKMQPSVFAYAFIGKWALFRKYLPTYSQYNIVWIDRIVLNSITEKNKIKKQKYIEDLIQYIKKPLIHTAAHDILSENPIEKITLLNIFSFLGVYFLFRILFVSSFLFLYYKDLSPSF